MSAAPRMQSADRVALMLALVPYILANDGVTIDELSAAFNVAPPEIRELVNRLRGLGVPGESGVYLPNDLFQIDDELFEIDDMVSLTHTVGLEHAPRLSGYEAAALVAGLQYVSALLPASEAASVAALQKKLARGSASPVANIEIEQQSRPDVLELLTEAHAASRQLIFDYPTSAGGWQARQVDVIRLDMVGGHWYLRGWCHLRDALRTFRCDRMRNVTVSAQLTTTNIDPQSIPLELFDLTDQRLATAIFDIEESALEELREFTPTVVKQLQPGLLEVAVSFRDADKIVKVAAALPGRLSVREPVAARTQLIERAKRARASYEASER